MKIVSEYLTPLFQPTVYANKVNSLVRLIRKSNIKFKAVAFTGMSGSMIGPAVAARLKKDMVLIRKSGEDRHSTQEVEGRKDIKSYIIIDDRIATGDTVRSIMSGVSSFTKNQAKLMGIFLYYHPGFSSEEELKGIIKTNVPVRKLNDGSAY